MLCKQCLSFCPVLTIKDKKIENKGTCGWHHPDGYAPKDSELIFGDSKGCEKFKSKPFLTKQQFYP